MIKRNISGCLPSPTAAVTVGVNQLMTQADNRMSNVSIATPAETILTLTYRRKVKGRPSTCSRRSPVNISLAEACARITIIFSDVISLARISKMLCASIICLQDLSLSDRVLQRICIGLFAHRRVTKTLQSSVTVMVTRRSHCSWESAQRQTMQSIAAVISRPHDRTAVTFIDRLRLFCGLGVQAVVRPRDRQIRREIMTAEVAQRSLGSTHQTTPVLTQHTAVQQRATRKFS